MKDTKERLIKPTKKELKADKWFYGELLELNKRGLIETMGMAKVISRLEIYKQLLK